jgi:hypothetical protein
MLNCKVYVDNGVMYAAQTDGKSAFSVMNLTQIDETAFQGIQIAQSACRWMDDGINLEVEITD